jgi:glycosyltransferase involved in cell wall biosynthesis
VKVLYFIESLRMGGKERQHVELLKGLFLQTDINVLVVCMDREDFYRSLIDEVGVPLQYLERRVRWDPSLFRHLYRIIVRFRPHIIHTDSWMTTFYALPIAKLLRISLINGSIRNTFSSGGIRWHIERLLLLCSDYRVANSKAGMSSRRLSLNSDRNLVIYNGFDFQRIANVTQPHNSAILDLPQGQKIVGMVAEFSVHKDYASYILSAQQILTRRNDVTFLAVGDGAQQESCSHMLPPGSCNIRFLGKQSNVEHLVSTFDIGVLSTHSEGISNSIMEYMAFAKPVVATDAGGTRELVLNARTGFLVPHRDPNTLAERIEYLLDRPSIAARMGAAGKKRLQELFSLDRMVENVLQLYESAVLH